MSAPTPDGPARISGRAVSVSADAALLAAAVELSRRCPPSPAAYSVGALVVAPDGRVLASGHSRQGDPAAHAEEVALAALPPGAAAGATVYTSLEPCTHRRSRPRGCAALIIAAGVSRVVLALREPPTLAPCTGVADLLAAGIAVVELVDLAPAVRAVNAHLMGEPPGA
ncbi:dCMP deaminase [Pilimelia terevasa]|nr:dCMP deaminase [Pilimelia terevasa]